MKQIFISILLTNIFDFAQQSVLDHSLSINKFYSFDNSFQVRTKREENACPEACIKSMSDKITNTAPELIALAKQLQTGPKPMGMKMTKNQFETFCMHIIEPFILCIEECPSTTTLKLVLNHAFAGEKFMCIEHFMEFYDNYECMQKAHTLSYHDCESVHGNCSLTSEAPEKFAKESKKLLQREEYDEFSILMDSNCEFLRCSKPCEALIMEQHCGANFTRLVDNDMVGITIRSARDMLYMTDKKDYFPFECTRLLLDTNFNTPFKANQTNDESNGQYWLHESSFIRQIFSYFILLFFVRCLL